MFTLTYEREFHAAHHLPNDMGPCRKNHGHNWIAIFICAGEKLDENGMLVHFDVLKNVCPDHEDLNEWMSAPPTTENLARELFARLRAQGVPIQSVTVRENARASVTYTPSIPRQISSELLLADTPVAATTPEQLQDTLEYWEGRT